MPHEVKSNDAGGPGRTAAAAACSRPHMAHPCTRRTDAAHRGTSTTLHARTPYLLPSYHRGARAVAHPTHAAELVLGCERYLSCRAWQVAPIMRVESTQTNVSSRSRQTLVDTEIRHSLLRVASLTTRRLCRTGHVALPVCLYQLHTGLASLSRMMPGRLPPIGHGAGL